MKFPKPKAKQSRKNAKGLLDAIRAQPCAVCGSRQVIDACHVKTYASGGITEDWNLVAMCREHHRQQHSIGFESMCRKYPQLADVLKHKGWRFVDVFGIKKLWHSKSEIEPKDI